MYVWLPKITLSVDVVAPAFNSSPQEAEADVSVSVRPDGRVELQINEGYVERPCLWNNEWITTPSLISFHALALSFFYLLEIPISVSFYVEKMSCS